MRAKGPSVDRDAGVAVRVGDQSYQLRANVDPAELRRLAALVDARIRAIVPAGRPIPPSAVILAAIALAHDLEEERARGDSGDRETRTLVASLLARVDAALADDEPLSVLSAVATLDRTVERS